MVGTRKGYETVYWDKMPINFRPQAFRREEIERAVDHAPRSFPDVLNLVPDFSVLTVGKDLGREETAVLVLRDEGEARGFRHDAGEGNLEGLLWEVALLGGRGVGEGRGASTPGRGERSLVPSSLGTWGPRSGHLSPLFTRVRGR